MSLPPGPDLHPLIQLYRWIRRPLDFLSECRARYGDTFTLRRRPEAFPDPEKFDPDRFLQKNAKISPSEWFPFGGGIRRCVGMAFALYEMKMVLAVVLSRGTLRLASRRPIQPVRRAITLSPSEGLPLVLEARASRSAPPRARREGAAANTPELVDN